MSISDYYTDDFIEGMDDMIKRLEESLLPGEELFPIGKPYHWERSGGEMPFERRKIELKAKGETVDVSGMISREKLLKKMFPYTQRVEDMDYPIPARAVFEAIMAMESEEHDG